MQINLRKANAVQAEIKKAISGVKVEMNVSVDEFTTDFKTVVVAAQDSLVKAIARKRELTKALFEIEARLEKAKASPQADSLRASMYGINKVETSVVTLSLVAEAKLLAKSFKRDKQELQDRLLQLNVNTLISLSDQTVTLLQEEGIL